MNEVIAHRLRLPEATSWPKIQLSHINFPFYDSSKFDWLGGISQDSGSYYIILQYTIGVSLSKPHTSMTALGTCMCMLACLLATISGNLNERI